MLYTHSLRILSLVIMGMIFPIPITQATASSQKDNAVITTLFSQTKPQCIGRYIIDVPQSFNNQSNNMIFIDDFRIESQFLYPPAFKQRIRLREKELQNEINNPENEPEDAPFIKEIIQLPEGKGVIFDSNRPGSDDLYRRLEAHVYVDMFAFTITTNIRDFSAPKYRDRKAEYLKTSTEAQTNTKPAKLAAMKSLISRLSGRKDESIPTEKGLCIPNGFIKDDGGKHQEKVGFSYKNEDFGIGIKMDNTIKGDNDTLFNRSADINDSLKYTYKKTIKKYPLSPHGIPSETWLFGGIQKYNNAEMKVYDFILYANEAIASPTQPMIKIGLNSEYRQTRYSEAEMIEIWDRIVNSLRYRPNAF